jgi:AcrR family transcriptional regulator
MTTSARAPRADSVRNRELLLAAAEKEFAEKGPDVTVADIAARAGLGKGTFFRHFATKDDLLAAVVRGRVDDLDGLGQRLLLAADAGEALLEFLTESADQRQQGGVEFLIRASESNPVLAGLRETFFSTVTALVTRAQSSGAIRSDITGTDVILLMCAPAHIVENLPDAPPDLWKRYLAMIFDGLRPGGAHPLPTAQK